jgi:gluconolactonase
MCSSGLAALAFVVLSCGSTPESESAPPKAETSKPLTLAAELIGSDASWGNTEGPAVDSKGTLYFTSRGTFKGIVSWTEASGAGQYLTVATGAGPGGLWIDDKDNIYATATDERQILKISPDKKVSVVAEKFEANPEVSKGPNDIVIASDGAVYFTAPNGYDGSAPNGTIYRTSADGKTTVFSAEITGPNGIVLSADEKTLYVSHNTAATTAKIETWPINPEGTAGAMRELITVPDCVADGMTVDQKGNVWLTCYSFGTAHLVSPQGTILQTITTEQKALTNIVFGRGADNHTVYLTSSDMERVTGYVYRAKVEIPGLR